MTKIISSTNTFSSHSRSSSRAFTSRRQAHSLGSLMKLGGIAILVIADPLKMTTSASVISSHCLRRSEWDLPMACDYFEVIYGELSDGNELVFIEMNSYTAYFADSEKNFEDIKKLKKQTVVLSYSYKKASSVERCEKL